MKKPVTISHSWLLSVNKVPSITISTPSAIASGAASLVATFPEMAEPTVPVK